MAPRRGGEDASIYWRLFVQSVLILLAIANWNHPVLQPLKLLVVLLHEMSHGLMALATGGTVEDVFVAADETGACRTAGGNDLLIISAGYLGSMFFGGVFLSSSRSRSRTVIVYALTSLLVFGAAITVMEDGYSRRFALGVAAASILLGAFSPAFLATFLLRCVGTVSCLYALIDIYDDTLSRIAREYDVLSDASAFSEITGVSPETVGLAWLVVSVAYFLVALKASLGTPDGGEPEEVPAGAKVEAQ